MKSFVVASLMGVALALANPAEQLKGNALKYGRDIPANRASCTDCGDGPLILSPLLKEGRIEEARNLSAVNLPMGDGPSVPSFSGYYVSDEAAKNNMFWWYVFAVVVAPPRTGTKLTRAHHEQVLPGAEPQAGRAARDLAAGRAGRV